MIKGFDNLKKNIDKLNKDLEGILPTALKAGALIIQKDAKRIAKEKKVYETGTLMRSIHTEPVSKKQVRVGTDVKYAIFHEYGTSKMTARPYLRPALDNNRQAVIDKINDVIKMLFKKG